MSQELCCLVNGSEECYKCKDKICTDHCRGFNEKLPCRCGTCNDTELRTYCLPCVDKFQPADYYEAD